ncbi:lactonase family protein [Roseomonas populi]|uniref:Lactonase family protein n=1 Tax=Roseomonas populi TaxID=3121582 RepID=A0ABT1X3J2_9PROT|nr:lactonase family protein [Roseomonas pecuniae]MCR0982658.1 lactonase family protein [Roseomonas pecuniae]
MTDAYHVYVGCRTTRERNARGDGIQVYRMEASSGRWTHVQLVEGLVNPSFLALDRTGRFLYAVHGDREEISAFRVEPGSGRLTFLNAASTGGRNPVHLAVDPTNRFIVVPNHVTSTLAVLRIDRETGHLSERTDLVALEGATGPHKVEQPFAKPHQTEFDRQGRFVIVPDKGLDRVFAFRLDPAAGKLAPSGQGSVVARENAGPRHVAMHPGGRLAHVLNELDSTITTYHYDPDTGALEPFQLLPSLPDSFTGNSRAAEITVSADGRFVYASNRGHDSVGVFAVEKATGRLAPVEWVSVGRTPRFITLDPSGRFLFVASEDDDAIAAFSVSPETGRLAPAGEAARTGSPVCIIFLPA